MSDQPSGPHEVVMPDDGWDDREVSFRCEWCDRTLVARSVYLNLDALLEMGVTQAEWFLNVHLNDHAEGEYEPRLSWSEEGGWVRVDGPGVTPRCGGRRAVAHPITLMVDRVCPVCGETA